MRIKKITLLVILISVCCGSVLAQKKAKEPKEPPPVLRPKEEIIDFIFAKSQKYNPHPADFKRTADTIVFNAKIKAEINIYEIDTITVDKATITIKSALGIQKYNYDKKKMVNYPDLQLSLETHDWNFYEEDLFARLTRAAGDYMRALREEQSNKRKAGHDPSDPY
ncbi:MAG: hypothetical protein JWQ38_1115 [Flavipsychrobacter sp.]|nr:hypothetical protein [Flavipsychrobacter sp.]